MTRFIITAAAALVFVGLVSLIWPKLTNQPRPEVLTRVRGFMMQTPVGQNAVRVLGITDESGIEPINVASLAASGGSALVSGITESVQHAVTSRILTELSRKFDELPAGEKEQFRSAICKPQKE